MNIRPRVFIGSSSEGLDTAHALQNTLEKNAEITVWDQDVFKPSEFILESLIRQLEKADLGVFVFTPDDIVQKRGEQHWTMRDNVLFEFGLYVGCLGRFHSLIVTPRGQAPRLPSDLMGINVLDYEPERSDGNLDAALGPASSAIRRILGRMEPRPGRFVRELQIPILQRRDLLTATQRRVLTNIEEEGPASMDEISGRFPDMPRAELQYRLEQLRLLMFVVRTKKPDRATGTGPSHALTSSKRYALAPFYARELDQRRISKFITEYEAR